MQGNSKTKEAFEATFAALKTILQKYAPALVVQVDEPDNYYLNSTKSGIRKQPIFFAAAQIKKNYVSFHLMPVYCCKELLEGMSEGLRARMQGKSCFNFKAIDPAHVEELTRLTERAFLGFKAAGYI